MAWRARSRSRASSSPPISWARYSARSGSKGPSMHRCWSRRPSSSSSVVRPGLLRLQRQQPPRRPRANNLLGAL
eukprot:324793-Pyramimonas_sp.AAC.1